VVSCRLMTDRLPYEKLRKSSADTIRSQSVIISALRNPSIAAMPIIKQQTDPVDWLQKNLEVGFPNDVHLLTISVRGTAGEKGDLMNIANAVAQATTSNLIATDGVDRLIQRDTTAHHADELREKLKKLLIFQKTPTDERGNRVDAKELQAEIDLVRSEWVQKLHDLEADETNESSQ
jgi:hypothetical protein